MARDVIEVLVDNADTLEVLTDQISVVEIIDAGPQGPEPSVPAAITYIFDGGGVQLTTGLKGSIIVPFACTINSWTMVAEPTGSIDVDIWRTPLADYPPEIADAITGSAKPSISGGHTASSSSLGTWDTAIAEGDVLSFYVDSVSSVVLASISLKVTRS